MSPQDIAKYGGFAFPGEHSADAETIKSIREETGLGMQDVKRLLSRHGGMTLRDWFAGHALSGINAHHGRADMQGDIGIVANKRAEDAYAQADAMLAARQR